jgi:glycosyltransferase involved in cell wall biosynthesis
MTGLNYQKPIIATRLSAFEAVLEDGKNALLVDGPTIHGLADAMLRMIRDPELYLRLVENAQENPKKQVQWDDIAAKTELVYLRLLKHIRQA